MGILFSISVGIPAYGRGFYLSGGGETDPDAGDASTGFGLPAIGPTRPGGRTATPGLMASVSGTILILTKNFFC